MGNGNCGQALSADAYAVCCGYGKDGRVLGEATPTENVFLSPARDGIDIEALKKNGQVIRAIIKFQAAYRGHYTRKLIKAQEMCLSMTDPEFGMSLYDNYNNATVQEKI